MFLATSGLFQTRLPSCGGRSSPSEGPSPGADRSKVTLPGAAGLFLSQELVLVHCRGPVTATRDSRTPTALSEAVSLGTLRRLTRTGASWGGLGSTFRAPVGPDLGLELVTTFRETGSYSRSPGRPGPRVTGGRD